MGWPPPWSFLDFCKASTPRSTRSIVLKAHGPAARHTQSAFPLPQPAARLWIHSTLSDYLEKRLHREAWRIGLIRRRGTGVNTICGHILSHSHQSQQDHDSTEGQNQPPLDQALGRSVVRPPSDKSSFILCKRHLEYGPLSLH